MNTTTISPVALVTGVGKGRIGSEVARTAARRGYRVAVHFNSSRDEAEMLVSECEKLGTASASFQADIRNEDSVEIMMDSILREFGRIDLCVNCAATWLSKPLEDTHKADIMDSFSTNTLGTFLISKSAGLSMTKQTEGGHIVTIGDWAVERPYRDYAAYLLSKGAIATLTKILAVELAERNPKVRVNCLAPGPIQVPNDSDAKLRQEFADATLLRKIGGPESIAQAVFALTDNEFITGAVLPVDGGRSIFAREK